MRQTLFTPTYNRRKTLQRLYDSIKNQTFKDFVWLIVDDGSTDDTDVLIHSFIQEDLVNIKYVYKENGGKHTATKLAWDIVSTPYITEIDSDDELMPDAMEIIEKSWIEIEQSGHSEIGRICMFCKNEQGSIVGHGNYALPIGMQYYDTSFFHLILNERCHKELAGSYSLDKMKECFSFDDYLWHTETNHFFGEGIYWARLGRRYKIRLLNYVGRIYHTDGDDSLLRGNTSESINGLYNRLTNAVYFTDDNIDQFWRNPIHFIRTMSSVIILGKRTNTKTKEIFDHVSSRRFKRLYCFCYLPFVALYRLRLRDH